MQYRTLEKLFHADRTSNRFLNAEKAYQERLTSESSFRTGIQLRTGELFLAVPRELSLENEQLLRRERRVSALWKSLPAVALHAYISSLILDEVVFSNEIEGVRSTRQEIEFALEHARRDTAGLKGAAEKEHAPFAEFAQLYLGLTGNPTPPSTLRDIRGIFEAVAIDAIDKNDVPRTSLFRTGPVVIEDGRGRIRHEGAAPREIEPLLLQWLALSQSDEMPEVFSAILCHFLFGYIHPFYDGNGRTGRYLLALHLSKPLSEPTVLSLSRTIAENKNAYYKAFDEVERPLNHAEATPLLLTMLDLVGQAQEKLIADLEDKRMLIEKLRTAIDAPELDLSSRSKAALFYACQMELVGGFDEVLQSDMATWLDVSIPTARSTLRDLESHGLVSQTSSRPPKFRITEKAKSLIGYR